MNVLFLHGGGWDELALLGVAILIAFLVVRFTTRGDTHQEEPPTPGEPSTPGETRPPT